MENITWTELLNAVSLV